VNSAFPFQISISSVEQFPDLEQDSPLVIPQLDRSLESDKESRSSSMDDDGEITEDEDEPTVKIKAIKTSKFFLIQILDRHK